MSMLAGTLIRFWQLRPLRNMHLHHLGIPALLLTLTTGCSTSNPDHHPRTVLAIDEGDNLAIFVADGPQSCASPKMTVVVGPSCDSPSWQLVVRVPADSELGEPIDLFAVPDEPVVGIEFGMQQGECHTGEPSLDSGTVTLGPIEGGERDVALSVVAQSSFDPSGDYRAKLCE